jgi:hypothetical protein
VTTTAPAAAVTPSPATEQDLASLRMSGNSATLVPGNPHNVLLGDGTELGYFATAYGKRFARIVEKSGFTFWMREIDTPPTSSSH